MVKAHHRITTQKHTTQFIIGKGACDVEEPSVTHPVTIGPKNFCPGEQKDTGKQKLIFENFFFFFYRMVMKKIIHKFH